MSARVAGLPSWSNNLNKPDINKRGGCDDYSLVPNLLGLSGYIAEHRDVFEDTGAPPEDTGDTVDADETSKNETPSVDGRGYSGTPEY
jgi:hypothetical protein